MSVPRPHAIYIVYCMLCCKTLHHMTPQTHKRQNIHPIVLLEVYSQIILSLNANNATAQVLIACEAWGKSRHCLWMKYYLFVKKNVEIIEITFRLSNMSLFISLAAKGGGTYERYFTGYTLFVQWNMYMYKRQ